MTTIIRNSAVKKLGLGIAGLSLFLALVGIGVIIVFGVDLTATVILVNAVVYSVIGVLIIARQPRHTVGWLLLSTGFISATLMFVSGLGQSVTNDSSVFLHRLGAWIGLVLFLPALMIPLTLVLQFFPNGRLPSRRWWPIPAASLFGILGIVASIAFLPGPMEAGDETGPSNPFGITGSESFLKILGDVAEVAFAIGVIGALLILVVRFRSSVSIERTQMKWLFYTAVIGLSLLLFLPPISRLLGIGSDVISEKIFVIMPSLLAITIGIAILRYRLFDIDIIIRRTLQYAIITVVLALVYFGLVVILQAAFAAVGEIQSPIFIVISTLVIAGLFNPVRIRVQNAVDRRFYRQKYHAEQALAQFAAAARDEVDLDRLAAVLLDVVEETMRPERASISLFMKEKD